MRTVVGSLHSVTPGVVGRESLSGMSTPEAGWYDDPWSATQYRYWDGAMWTPHVAPRQAPPQAQVAPPPSSPSTSAPTTYGGPGGPTPYSGYASGGSTGVQGGYAGGHAG